MQRIQTEWTRVYNIGDCVGKTIDAAFDDGDSIALRFADGTYFFAQADPEGEDDASLNSRGREMRPGAALLLGIIDRAEHDRAQEAERAEILARDRDIYERLRARFEGHPEGPRP